ncbi:MAG: glycosyltransferase family 4 protein [Dermatophilaceae bacterium]
MTVRVALLSYRSKPHCGGQGIYLRHLSRELVALGHEVTVFSGQPYPELDPGVDLVKVPSLDLYREPDPFRVPHLREFRSPVDVLEFATMCTAGFPEPWTFGKRLLRDHLGALRTFDVIHDNQTLAHGVLALQEMGLPLVASIHHPITMDRKLDLAAAPMRKQLSLRRWYGFLRMQKRVAARLKHIVTVSQSSALDIVRDFGVDPARIDVIPLGVQPEVFTEYAGARVPGRIVAMASADSPLKGIKTLLESVAKLRTERDVTLTLVSKPTPGGVTERLVDRLGLADVVSFVHGLSVEELAATMGSAEIVCVPSLYEGFSLPTLEAMACGTPLVVSDGGAIPEVVGEPGVCADIVPAGDAEALTAALRSLLDDPERRARMGRAARERARTEFSWEAVARATAAVYEHAIHEARAGR